MASKVNRSRFDHETRGRRSKISEPLKEPARPRTHWDHVLEEMIWLAKDFESERKWKLAQAKRVAIRVSKSGLDQASRGEKRLKEEEQRIRRLASNIAKDVRKFWMKIEKLVLYKHQLELEERKRKTLDKQLDFLLGQTERYSTMLAENLVDISRPPLAEQSMPSEVGNAVSVRQKESDRQFAQDPCSSKKHTASSSYSESSLTGFPDEETLCEAQFGGKNSYNEEAEDDFSPGSVDYLEDDEATLEADEAMITEEERREELAALKDEIDLPLEELMKRYLINEGSETAGNHVHDEIDSIKQDVAQMQDKRSKFVRLGVENVESGNSGKDVSVVQMASLDLLGTNREIFLECHKKEGFSAWLDGETEARNVGSSNVVFGESRDFSEQRMDAIEEKDGDLTVSLLIDLSEASNTHVLSTGNDICRDSVSDIYGGRGQDDDPSCRVKDEFLSTRHRRTIKEATVHSDSDNELAF